MATRHTMEHSRWALEICALAILMVPVLSRGADQPGPVEVSGGSSWLDPDGRPLPFSTFEAIEDYLRTAEVIEVEGIPTGITKPQRVLLDREGVRMHACFRHVRVNKRVVTLESGAVRYNFRDDAVYEAAAYELAKLLGYRNIPPTVVRKIRGTPGTLQVWVENAKMEKDRIEERLRPARPWLWVRQLHALRLFDALVYNDDRNQGNILIDPDWRIWLIDHTRCFRTYRQVPNLDQILWVEEGVWLKLTEVPDAMIEQKLKPFLGKFEIRTLLIRRARLVEHLSRQIQVRGAARVLYRLWTDSPALHAGGLPILD